MQNAGRGAEGRTRGRVGQVGHPPRTPQANRTVKHAHRHFPHASQLAGAAAMA